MTEVALNQRKHFTASPISVRDLMKKDKEKKNFAVKIFVPLHLRFYVSSVPNSVCQPYFVQNKVELIYVFSTLSKVFNLEPNKYIMFMFIQLTKTTNRIMKAIKFICLIYLTTDLSSFLFIPQKENIRKFALEHQIEWNVGISLSYLLSAIP